MPLLFLSKHLSEIMIITFCNSVPIKIHIRSLSIKFYLEIIDRLVILSGNHTTISPLPLFAHA